MDPSLIHDLIDLVYRNDVVGARKMLGAAPAEVKSKALGVLSPQVSALDAAISILPDSGAQMAEFLIGQGAADALSPRHVNALYHRVYAHLALAPDPSMRVLEAFWSRGIGKNLGGHCWTPAHMAASLPVAEDAIAHLRRLLECGFDLHAPDEVGETPFLVATWKSSVDTASFLLAHGADINATTAGGRDAVGYAIMAISDGREDVATQNLKWLRCCGFPVENSMARHRLGNAATQARLEAAVMEEAVPAVATKRNGHRL